MKNDCIIPIKSVLNASQKTVEKISGFRFFWVSTKKKENDLDNY